MHYTRVYYWVSSWWANRIGLASLIYLIKYTTQQEQVIENNKISTTKLCSNFF